MELGSIGIWWSSRTGDDGLAEAVPEMEAAGYRTLWMSGGFKSGVARRFERMLATTSRMTVASGIIGVWQTPAEQLASEVVGLEGRYPGRFLLGLGVSHAPVIDGSGMTYERPFQKMVGFLDELDASSPTVPPDRRALAALGPRMLRLSAERSLGAHPYFVPLEHTRQARETLGEGPLLAPEVAVVLEEDPGRAREIARGYTAGYLSLPNYSGNLVRLGYSDEDVAGGGSDRLVDAVIPWGAVETVARRVTEHLEAGADHVCVQIIAEDGRFPTAGYQRLAVALDLGPTPT